jgi:hypothetical protein
MLTVGKVEKVWWLGGKRLVDVNKYGADNLSEYEEHI